MLDLRHRAELIASNAFIADNATVLGNVTMESDASVWFGAVVRGDAEAIKIGSRSNVQDLCVLHADPGFPCIIGDGVTIGHSAIVHGATIHDGAMIGIRAVVLNGAIIGPGALIGAGAVVTEGMTVPAGHLAVGVPAKVVRELSAEQIERVKHAAAHYVEAAKQYADDADRR
ncbi:MAG: gamma carbonic anhydrase family protein [Pirellulaceae bacterium]|nr:gamma carbonic anhydrase family protein [Pirellulaceae bacterium]